MITSKDEHSIRNSYPVPESPLDLLISKEELPAPGIVLDAETLIFLADFAAQHPHKWKTVKERINDPSSSYNDLAVRLGISRGAVIRHLNDLRKAGQAWSKGPMVSYKAKSA